MKNVLRIARKEFNAFFATPVAFLFFGTFLTALLFIFFWVETFFARNIADIRPLFDWMPILLIFLCAALTMRSWAEERRSGTLEFLMTAPVRPLTLVLGKFLACLALIGVTLVRTLPLPLTVSFMGPLDWGPVAAGYLATFFLAAAYLAIGLFISVRSDNQIISLIGTVLACGLFYLPGSKTLTSLVGNRGAEILALLGSGSRFDSITRGVIDIRDLLFYCSITAVFLLLNVYGLERLRWAGNKATPRHRSWNLLVLLLAANLLAVNFWIAPLEGLRLDTTRGTIYSISPATKNYLARLQEPLLIRGYFSAQTHPLLAPLVPRLRDLLKEYQIAGQGKVRVEFIDPLEHPELEQEAGQKYGIRPVPFETSSKYQASVTNSYFDILVKYGDQFETLGFRDLIEVKVRGERDLEVELRNPEYDITRAVKKVLSAYQGSGNLLANIKGKVIVNGYISADSKLPKELLALKKSLRETVDRLAEDSKGRITFNQVDPEADNGKIAAKLGTEYGFRPMVLSLLDPRTFWFYIVMENNGQTVQVPLPPDGSGEALGRSIDSGLKRFSRGFLKTVALHTPPFTPPMPRMGIRGGGKQFRLLRDTLGQEYSVIDADLKNGRVPTEADLLLLASPDKLDKKQLFAVDQFLMQGGTVAAVTAPFDVTLQGRLGAEKHSSGMEQWLAHQGINLEQTMILDRKNAPFPVPMERQVGMFKVRETRLINYPYFLDIRKNGMNRDAGMLAGLNQLTMTWASPITVDPRANKDRRVTELLHSSTDSWTSDRLDIQPDFSKYGELGFKVGDDLSPKLVGVMIEGQFSSWFKDKPNPLLEAEQAKAEKNADNKKNGKKEKEKEKKTVITRVIDRSPESARLVVFSSNSFLSDTSMGILSNVINTGYQAPVQLINNVVDWSLEDRDLLAIRGRGQFARTLPPMDRKRQMFWEYLNYGLALAGLFLIWLLHMAAEKRAKNRYQHILQQP